MTQHPPFHQGIFHLSASLCSIKPYVPCLLPNIRHAIAGTSAYVLINDDQQKESYFRLNVVALSTFIC